MYCAWASFLTVRRHGASNQERSPAVEQVVLYEHSHSSYSFRLIYIDHFRNELFMNLVYGYESRSRHGHYLPRPIVGLLYSTTVFARGPVSA